MPKKLKFVKMQGCGNDYIYFDCFEQQIDDPEALAVKLSDRHFGVGGDGVVLICPSKLADVKMRMFNIDGSEGKMCGNAIRCVGKYMHDVRGLDKDVVTVETLSGIKTLKLIVKDGVAVGAEVDMGKAELDPKKIPVALDGETVIDRPVKIGGGEYRITCVSTGNPHCVVFGGDPAELDLPAIGPKFESDPLFPERVNTEFIEVIDDHTLKMRVWERGSGETWACGTGTCATVAALTELGICPAGEDVHVQLRGGELTIRVLPGNELRMTGAAETVCEGTTEV